MLTTIPLGCFFLFFPSFFLHKDMSKIFLNENYSMVQRQGWAQPHGILARQHYSQQQDVTVSAQQCSALHTPHAVIQTVFMSIPLHG